MGHYFGYILLYYINITQGSTDMAHNNNMYIILEYCCINIMVTG